MTFVEYTQDCVAYLRHHPHLRWGRACWDVLEMLRPDIADTLRGTKFEPSDAMDGADIRPFWRAARSMW